MADENTQLATVAGTPPAPAATSDADQGEQSFSFLSSMGNADVLRQISLVLGLAICLALVVLVVLWAKEPNYRPLGKMDTDELVSTLDFLDQNEFQYKLDGNVVEVPEEDYQQIKLALTRAGLSRAEQGGEELILKDMGFGVSQRLEQERLKYSREQQLARAVEELKAVSRARVLLALPKESVFARQRQKPSATVVVNLRRGGTLSQEEVDSIVDMVASAVQGMEPSKVTVTDQDGRLLNSGSQDMTAARTRKEFELEKGREQQYLEKIDSILIPVVGLGNYTAQVDVSMDFTAVEQTAKRFDPQQQVVRSEMILDENRNGGALEGGIPGALSNQPPADAEIPEEVTQAEQAARARTNGSSRSETTRNYELDTTISHTRQQVGRISRLTVSVAVDHKTQTGADGNSQRVALSEAELDNIRRLLSAGVGLDQGRGDSLEVVSVPFSRPELEQLEALPFYKEAWFVRIAKMAIGALLIVVLIFAVVRPLLRRLLHPEAAMDDFGAAGGTMVPMASQGGGNVGDLGDDDGFVPGVQLVGGVELPDLRKDEEVVKAIRALVANEPELSAQVVKGWLTDDGK
ncbi:flagellar basal-body MS-ring/collar protein FliF [Gallaecimonas sp. GXIMD4217]|uniref:flagellar basal-body MS-ring/collar protein FliF n=1 Tax=Gallaecimonas sp. GXIMD4217 TaxID=3131927 RepID=UPI00311ACFB7